MHRIVRKLLSLMLITSLSVACFDNTIKGSLGTDGSSKTPTPIPDQIKIEDAGNGSGNPVSPTMSMEMNSNFEMYAVKRDSDGNYKESIEVAWVLIGTAANLLVKNNGKSAELVPVGIGFVQVKAVTEGETVEIQVEVVPDSPDVFTFTDLNGQLINTQIESDLILISGLNGTTNIGVLGNAAEYRVCTDGTNSGTCDGTELISWGTLDNLNGVDDGHYVQVRMFSSTSALTTVSTSLTIGSLDVDWDIETLMPEVPPVASSVTFTGTEQEGQTLTGSYTYSDLNGDLEGASTLQWYRADDGIGTGRAAIAGANSLAYVLQAADVGKFISFEVTPVALSGASPGSAVDSGYSAAIIPAEAAPTASSVNITGTTTEGETLTGNYTYGDVNGDTEGISTFRWLRDDDGAGTNKGAIGGATSNTYVLQAADVGKHIYFEITPVATSGASPGSAVESASVGAVIYAPAAPTASSVTFTGTLSEGQTLTGSYTYGDVNGDGEGTSTFRWLRDDDGAGTNKGAIGGATSNTYVLQAADVGKYIYFEVTPVTTVAPTTGTPVESSAQGATSPPPITWDTAFENTDLSYSNGDLSASRINTTNIWKSSQSSSGWTSGKWYWEITVDAYNGWGPMIGVAPPNFSNNNTNFWHASEGGYGYHATDGNMYFNGVNTDTESTFGAGDVIGIALDLDNDMLWYSVNGVWQNSGDPATQTLPQFTGLTLPEYRAAVSAYTTGNQWTANFGATSFTHTVPAGFIGGQPSYDTTLTSISALNITDTGFEVNVFYQGDDNADATVTLRWCNVTDNSSCVPANDSSMSRVGNTHFNDSVVGLSSPNDPGDAIKIEAVVVDGDGVSNSPVTGTITLKSIETGTVTRTTADSPGNFAWRSNSGVTTGTLPSAMKVTNISSDAGWDALDSVTVSDTSATQNEVWAHIIEFDMSGLVNATSISASFEGGGDNNYCTYYYDNNLTQWTLFGGACETTTTPATRNLSVVGAPDPNDLIDGSDKLYLAAFGSYTSGSGTRTILNTDFVSLTVNGDFFSDTPGFDSNATPDDFDFTDRLGLALSTTVESDIVQINGIADGTNISIDGGGSYDFRVCGDSTCSGAPAFGSGSTTIDNGEYVQLQLESSALEFTSIVTNLTVGNVTRDWMVRTLLSCPDNTTVGTYVAVGSNDDYNISDFCVMKYEAKLEYQGSIEADGNYDDDPAHDYDARYGINPGDFEAVSVATGRPWVYMKRGNNNTANGEGAIEACQSMGSGYDLPTNDHWQTLTRDIYSVDSNWNDFAVGGSNAGYGGTSTNFLNRGHSDGTPNYSLEASSDDNDACINTGQEVNPGTDNSCPGTGAGFDPEKRTHLLNTGDTIWDVSSNAWEYVKDNNTNTYGITQDISEISYATHTNAYALTDGNIPLARVAKDQFGPLDDLLDLNSLWWGGLGRAWLTGPNGILIRGGDHNNTDESGIFSVQVGYSSTLHDYTTGFRCIYEPPQFHFDSVSEATTGITYYSGDATALHESGAISFTVTGDGSPTALINGVDQGTSGTINPGDRVRLKLSSSGSFSTTNTATITADGYSSTFSVTTEDGSFACPSGSLGGEFIRVPAVGGYAKRDFCIMKYEAKAYDGSSSYDADGLGVDTGAYVPRSDASNIPWRTITRNDAEDECQSLGPGYDLPTNDEWQNLANQIEMQDSNWTGGSIGSGCLIMGNNGNATCGYNGDDPEGGTGRNVRAKHVLANSAEIFDASGNVWEYVSDDSSFDYGINDHIENVTRTSGNFSDGSNGPKGYAKEIWGPIGEYGTANNYHGVGYLWTNYTGGGIARSGSYTGTGSQNGVYQVSLNINPSSTSEVSIGFRCVYRPQ